MTCHHPLKKWRESKSLTQREVAEGVGVHVQYISDIERGKRRPGMPVAIKLSEFTDGALSVDDLAHARQFKKAA